jgi:hypothetical protein
VAKNDFSTSLRLPRFPQAAKEIVGGCVIGSATAYVLIVHLSFPILATALVCLVLLLIKAANEK